MDERFKAAVEKAKNASPARPKTAVNKTVEEKKVTHHKLVKKTKLENFNTTQPIKRNTVTAHISNSFSMPTISSKNHMQSRYSTASAIEQYRSPSKSSGRVSLTVS
jgi:hypothetical protein